MSPTTLPCRKYIFWCIVIFFTTFARGYPQAKVSFSGDFIKFKDELKVLMGPNLNQGQTLLVNKFLGRWDSSGFSADKMETIISVSGKMVSRNLRPAPHFLNYLKALTDFSNFRPDGSFFNNWLSALSTILSDPSFSTESINNHLIIASSMMRDNVLYESPGVKWKVKNKNVEFSYDTVFSIKVSDVTLTCYSQGDSTEIYNVSGTYYPHRLIFEGAKGVVKWEKAGLTGENVKAGISNYKLNIARSSFKCDSALLTYSRYFNEPVYGVLTDQVTKISNPEKATYPKFETYVKQFKIENIYEGVNYEGGLSLTGSTVNGTGQDYMPARISLFKNDTLCLKIQSRNFLLSKTVINSQEASATLYLEKDSIFHSNIGFSYNTLSREVNLFSTNSPVSKSPFYDSYHNMDMYFEYLSWDMDESTVIMSKARGSSIGFAQFESVTFYNDYNFQKIMRIDDYHPLYRLKQFADYYYSETFPVKDFALWLKRPEEAVTGLCIDLANKGFLFYDRTLNEVTLKKKVDSFINSSSGKKDYDVLSISSETSGETDNASLDLGNLRLTINGVSGVLLSDSQKVALYPYNRQLVVGKNRDISFDGVVRAGLFTIFGHDFGFNYDTFKIRLQKIDSIRISVETGETDQNGNRVIEKIDNLIELGTADLFIDSPENKSGLKRFDQYPIINAITDSYIFYDKIAGLEGIYKQSDVYFKIDPFTYENIDHYTYEELSLAGEFHAGNILKPFRQFLTIQEDNSLGFAMDVPPEGISLYNDKARMYNFLSMGNKGLTGSGILKRLTSTTTSDEFSFFPDSMLTYASKFEIERDESEVFPFLQGKNIQIKWLPEPDKWYASNTDGNNFNMFNNGTVLEGGIVLSPHLLEGSGIINMSDSRINSDLFRFTSNTIQADTSDYNLKSKSGDGYTFIAENANTNIDFNIKQAKFSLNTDSSVVKFPEIEYICTMTDFLYDMDKRILNMQQRGIASTTLMAPEELLKVDFDRLDKPTFFSTNNLRDTISFRALKGSYNFESEYIEANDINYIPVADALIQPDKGKITINKRAVIKPFENAVVAINNRHLLHSSEIAIENSNRYSGNGLYDYIDENNTIQRINFSEIKVDTSRTSASGYIAASENFMLNPAFTFSGDVQLYSWADLFTFTGAAGIVHNCDGIVSYPVKFKDQINPEFVMIPLGDKSRDINDNLIFSGSFITVDSTHIYPAFLSERKSWSDVPLIEANGYLYFEKETGLFKIGSKEKLANPGLAGEIITLDKNFCIITSEGKLNFGTSFDLFKLTASGKVIHDSDSSEVNIKSLIGLDFYFSPEALSVMGNEIKSIPSLPAVNIAGDLYNKGMNDLLGATAATQLKEEMDLYGTTRNIPKEFTYKLLLNDVNLEWNQSTSSFRSTGKIGVGFIGQQPINVYVDGAIDIQKRRSGDMIDIYLKVDNSTWYYFSYFRGVLMTLSGNNSYNTIVKTVKINDRKDPLSSVKTPYSYMIAVEDRLANFLRRIAGEPEIESE